MDDLIDFTEQKTEKIQSCVNNRCVKEESVCDTSSDYQLDNYYRNAMLLFCDHGAWTEDLVKTFQNYRFIVDKYEDLTSIEIEEKCASFFSRNFFEYGAVAVVMMEREMEDPDGPGMLRAREKGFHESVILKYLTTDVPLSLKGKPKIYITKTNCTENRIAIDDHEDILALHIPNSIFETTDDTREDFVSKLCTNMEKNGEDSDLLEIVKDTIREEAETIQKIEAICKFVGKENANYITPFFSNASPSDRESKRRENALVQQKPKLYCTFTKRCLLPVDIYFRQQNFLRSNLPVYDYLDSRMSLI